MLDGIAFVHIPIPEFVKVGNNKDYLGIKKEYSSCPHVNTGIFDAMRDANVKALFVGHDHDNNFQGNLEGVQLVYGRKAGYGGYMSFPAGSTVIEI